MDNKQIPEATSGAAISLEEYQAMETIYNEELKREVEQLVDSTLITALRENNMFQKVMSVEEAKDKLLQLVKQIVYEDMTQKGCAGYWQASDGTLAISNRLKERFDSVETRETIIHELLHALSTQSQDFIYNFETQQYEMWWGIQRNFEQKETGRGLNEGITEYLAQKLCPTHDYPYSSGLVSFNISGTYPMEQIAIKQLAILYGEDKIIDAYLNNHDIDMPQEQYIYLRTSFDYINERDSRKRKIYKGREWEELSESEQEEVLKIENNVETTFIDAQQYFLEHCLMDEINKISTIEQAEEMKVKLRELNSLGINIRGHEKANYAEYNFAFIRKYLQIVNQNKSYEEQVKFDDVEKYLLGEESSLVAVNNKLLRTTEKLKESDNNRIIKNVKIFFVESFQEIVSDIKDVPVVSSIVDKSIEGIRKGRNAIKNALHPKKEQFTVVDRGTEGKIYLKEVGQEIVAGNKISSYECLTEEQYEQYKAGDSTIKGKILRGNVDIDRLKKDKDYEFHVGHYLLSQDRIEDKLINYNGYVGSVGKDNRKYAISEVEKRFEEHEKYIMIKPKGYEQDMFIIEVLNKDNDDVSRYLILTKDEVDARRKDHSFEPGIIVQGNIDLGKLVKDDRYREIVEGSLLNREHIEESCKEFQGYVGAIDTNIFGYSRCNFTKNIEQFAARGADGEEKRQEKIGDKEVTWYLQKGKKTGEKDKFGNELYEYEFITSDEMKKMWADKEYKNSPNREKCIIIGSEEDMAQVNQMQIVIRMLYQGGYCGKDFDIFLDRENSLSFEDGIIWENDGVTYLSRGSLELALATKTKIVGNLDIGRFKHDAEYRKYVVNNVLTNQNVEDIFAGDKNSIEIIEEDGKFSHRVSKTEEQEKAVNSRSSQRDGR